jgi:hypothetical protein
MNLLSTQLPTLAATFAEPSLSGVTHQDGVRGPARNVQFAFGDQRPVTSLQVELGHQVCPAVGLGSVLDRGVVLDDGDQDITQQAVLFTVGSGRRVLQDLGVLGEVGYEAKRGFDVD